MIKEKSILFSRKAGVTRTGHVTLYEDDFPEMYCLNTNPTYCEKKTSYSKYYKNSKQECSINNSDESSTDVDEVVRNKSKLLGRVS